MNKFFKISLFGIPIFGLLFGFLGLIIFGVSEFNTEYTIKQYQNSVSINEWNKAKYLEHSNNRVSFIHNGKKFHITGTFTIESNK